MSLRRIVGATVVGTALLGAGLLLSANSGLASTPAATAMTLNLTGLASADCPLPLNGSLAVKPGTTVKLQNDLLLGASSSESVTITPAPNSTDPKSSKTIAALPSAGQAITFTRGATYTLSWHTYVLSKLPVLGGVVNKVTQVGATQKGKLVVNVNAQKCVVAVQVPVPSVSATLVPKPIQSVVNGVIGSAVNGVNGALSPVNSAIGPGPGPVTESVGTVSTPTTSLLPSAAAPATSGPSSGAGYQPNGPTATSQTGLKAHGSAASGAYAPSTDGSASTAPADGLVSGTVKSQAVTSTPAKSGGSPKTVDLSTQRPRSALPAIAVVIAIVALSGATAFYARTFLLNRSAGA